MRLTPNNVNIISEYVDIDTYMNLLLGNSIKYSENPLNKTRINLWNYCLKTKNTETKYFIPDDIKESLDFHQYENENEEGDMMKNEDKSFIISICEMDNNEYGIEEYAPNQQMSCDNCEEVQYLADVLDSFVTLFYYHPEGYYTEDISIKNPTEKDKLEYINQLIKENDPSRYPFNTDKYLYTYNEGDFKWMYCLNCAKNLPNNYDDMFVTTSNVKNKELKQNMNDWLPFKHEYKPDELTVYDEQTNMYICLNVENQYYGQIMWEFLYSEEEELYKYNLGFKNYNDYLKYVEYCKLRKERIYNSLNILL